MFNSDCSINYQYRDMFSSKEYIVTNKDNTRINDNIPIDFYNLFNWMQDNSIKNLIFSGKNYFDGIVCKVNYNELISIKNNYNSYHINEEAFEFNYIGGADF